MEEKWKETVNPLSIDQKQQTFLLKLSDALRPLGNPEDIEKTATQLALEFMHADRCYYSTIDGDNVIILHDAFRGHLPSVAGVHTINSFALYKSVLSAGRPFVVDDVCTSIILDEDLKKVCMQYQYGAFINVPIIKNSKPAGLFSLVQGEPRKWTDLELQLTVETAERIWAAVERAKAVESLRKSEEKYRTLFNSIDDAFSTLEILFDDNGKAVDYIFLEMNSAHEEMTGLSQDVVGKRLSELIPDIENIVLERLGEVVLTGKPAHYEQFVGTWNRWFDVHSSRVGGQGSRIVLNVFSNITERKQAEKKLKESEDRFRTMADASPVLIWTLDAAGLPSYYNKTYLDFLGVSTNEDITDWQKIVHPDDLKATSAVLNAKISARQSFSLECRLLRADGEWRWALAQGNPNFGANAEFLGYVGSSVDITERKEAEARIKESEQKFEAAIVAVEGIIWTNNAYGEMIGEQPGWAKLTGQTFEEYQGYGWSSVVHPDDAQPTVDAWNEAVKNKSTFVFEHRLKTKEQGWRLFSIKAVPAFNEEGSINQWVGVHTDITEQREVSQKIKDSEERYSTIIHAAGLGLWDFNVLTQKVVAAGRMYEIYGLGSNEEYTLDQAFKSIHPLDLEEQTKLYASVIAGNISSTFETEYRIIHKASGEVRWIRAKANAVFQNGLLIRTFGTVADITEKRKTDDSLSYQKSLLETVTQNTDMALFLLDEKEFCVYMNEAATKMTGFTLEELAEKQLHYYIHHTHPDGSQFALEECPIDQAFHSESRIKGEEVFVHKNGTFFPVSFTASPIILNGRAIGTVIEARETTEEKQKEEALKESEKRFRTLADDSPMFVFIIDPDPQALVSYNNKTWLSYTGLTAEQAVGTGWNGIMHPEDIPVALNCYVPALEARQPYFIPAARILRFDGEYRWHSFKGNPRYLPNGEFNGYIGVGFDIHEQKLAEEKLAYRTALLEAHNQASVDGILLVDVKGKIISFNQRYIEIWSMPQHIVDAKDDAAALSFAMTQLVHPQQFIDKVKYLYDHPTETSLDELEFKDGKIVERNGYPVIGEDGTYYAWSWTFRDVTKQKSYEKTILESEERFRLLSNEMPQFVWTGNAAGHLNYFNEAVYKYSGLSKEDIANEGWIQIVHPDDREENIRLWQQSIATGQDFIFEHRFKRADGEYRWQLSRAVPQRDAQGAIQQWIGTSTDIHDKKNVEEQLEQLVAERTKELQRSNEDLQQFAHVASHDLKEPVRKIETFTSRLEQHLAGKLDETGTRFIERIHVATNRMFNMIDGVLTYSTANASTQTAVEVDLTEVVKSLEIDLEVALQATGATLEYSILPSVEGAPVLLYQLFYNLINNSIKFTRAGVVPRVILSSTAFVEKDKSLVRITVQDNGIGFEPEQSGQIFETFTRLNSKDKYEGTGLGLSLCKKIVERHGGSIMAIGKPDEGATFIIILPVQQKQTSI